MKYIHPNSTGALSKSYKSILITIGLSLLLHIFFLVKIELPFNVYKSLRNDTLQVKIIKGSSNSAVIESVSPIKISEEKNVLLSREKKLDPPHPQTPEKSQTIPQSKISNQTITEPKAAIPESNQTEKPIEEKQVAPFAETDQLIPANEVNMSFTVVSVNDGKTLGQAQQHFTSDGRDNYKLSFTSNSLDENNTNESPDNQWSYEINGRIFGNRLSPSFYDVKGTLAESQFFLSRETKNENVVTERSTSGTMPDGILDRQSLIYHFMFKPPKDFDTQLLLSDGSKNSTYKVHIAGIELVNSEDLGKLRVVHMLISNIDNSETIELWLAPTLKYLPIKIRYSNGQDITTDLLVSKIVLK